MWEPPLKNIALIYLHPHEIGFLDVSCAVGLVLDSPTSIAKLQHHDKPKNAKCLAKYQQNLGKDNIFSSMVGDLYAKFLLKVDDFAYGEGVTVAILQSAPGTVYGLRACPTC